MLWLAGEQAGGQGAEETAQGNGAPQNAADVFLSERAGGVSFKSRGEGGKGNANVEY